MENGQIICPRRRGVSSGLKEFAAKGCYSVIFVILAVIAIRPLMIKQMISRADAYSAFGMNQECKRECNKAQLIDSDNSQAWCRLARLYRSEGDRDMAYAAFTRATESDPTNKPAHFEVGMMYVNDKRYQEAIPYFDQVRKLGQDKPEYLSHGGFHYHRAALDMLAMCYEKAGDITKAEVTLEEIRVFYPNYARVDPRLTELKERQQRK